MLSRAMRTRQLSWLGIAHGPAEKHRCCAGRATEPEPMDEDDIQEFTQLPEARMGEVAIPAPLVPLATSTPLPSAPTPISTATLTPLPATPTRVPTATATTEPTVLVDDASKGFYSNALSTIHDGTQEQFPLANVAGGDPVIFRAAEPDLAVVADILRDWLSQSPLPVNANWSELQPVPSAWPANTETAIIYPIEAGQEGISNFKGEFGVDNGIFVWVNGQFKFGALAPGGALRIEYTDIDIGSMPPGLNFIQILREDHGGPASFTVELTGDS